MKNLMKRIQPKKFLVLMATNLVILFIFLTPVFSIVQAQSGITPVNTFKASPNTQKLENPLGSNNNNLTDFAKAIVDALITVGLPIAALMLVYSGFLFVKARGNPSELDEAKRAFFYTIIGIAIILSLGVIAQVIKGTIDVLRG